MTDQKTAIHLILKKEGPMTYFSQLDLLTILKRSLRRSGLPNYFSRGFKPDIKISFKQALRLGEAGDLEAIFYFSKKILPAQVLKKLNKVLPKGLRVKMKISELKGGKLPV